MRKNADKKNASVTWLKLCGFFALTLTLALTGCASPPDHATLKEPKRPIKAVIILDEADHGKMIEVAQGSRIDLRLPENPSTGYSWELTPLKSDAIELQNDTYQRPSTQRPGAGGVHVFIFFARSPGKGRLFLRLRRPWEPKGEHAKTFEVTLQVLRPAPVHR